MGLVTDGLEGDFFNAQVPIHADDVASIKAVSDTMRTPDDPNGREAAEGFVQMAIRLRLQQVREAVRADPTSDFATRLRATSTALGEATMQRFFGPDEPAAAQGGE